MANKISVLIDVAVDQANRQLGSFKKSIQDAEGAAGKMRAGVTGSFNLIKANAGNLAIAGGAALVSFGAKAVGEFQRVALEAGLMSEALGIPVDDMSRLIEVAGDVGVPVDALEASIGRMNVTAGKTPGYFDEIGASISRNKDGTINVKDTFLNVVDALNSMPDSAKRAEAAQKIFGRGWKDMAELISLGADDITTAMEDVSEMQAISPEEVQKARDYRDAMDKLEDAMGGVVIAVGGALAPALTTISQGIGAVTTAVEELEKKSGINLFDGLFSADFWKFGDTWDNGPGAILKEITGFESKPAAEEIDAVTEAIEGVGTASDESGRMYVQHALGMQRAADETAARTQAATDNMERAWDDLNQHLSDRSAYLDVEDAIAGVEEAYLTAMDTADKSLAEQEADARAVERSVLDLKGKVNDYAKDVALLPPEVATELQTLIDEGAFAEVERRLGTLERIRIALITPQTGRAYGGVPDQTPGAKFHSGGVVGVGNFASNEVPAVLQKGEMVLTQGQQAAVSAAMAGGGSTTVNITVNGGDPNTIIAAIRKYVRTNGPITGIT